jgi:hypothetical protein
MTLFVPHSTWRQVTSGNKLDGGDRKRLENIWNGISGIWRKGPVKMVQNLRDCWWLPIRNLKPDPNEEEMTSFDFYPMFLDYRAQCSIV